MKQEREGVGSGKDGEGESSKRKVEAGKPVEGVQSMKRAIPTKRLVMVCMQVSVCTYVCVDSSYVHVCVHVSVCVRVYGVL